MPMPSLDAQVEMFRRMTLIRAFEDACHELYRRGELPGVLHLSIGQEAVSVGAAFDLGPEDWITSTHRGHNDIIAKGADVRRMMAELFAKRTGYCGAKGGSMHIADFALGILGANGIVGAGIPIAAGAALAAQLRGERRVAMCFFGDGAVNQGLFHEGVNLAAVWKLPVIFVCHNNRWAESTAQAATHAVADVAERARAYGIPGISVDAIDVTAVHEAASAAIARARAGEGPSLLNCLTYRWYGHHVGDADQPYRTKEDLAAARARDCIAHTKAALLAKGAPEGRLAAIERQIAAEIEDAVAAAKRDPAPGPEALHEDVLVGFDIR